MKNRYKFLALNVVSLALSSCGFNILFNTLKEIIIEDFHNAYQADETFANKNELNILAHYSNDEFELLSYSDVQVSLSDGKKELDPSKPFGSEGLYTVKVTYERKTSKEIEIYVNRDYVYATSIALSLEKDEVDVNTYVDGSFAVLPSNYNVDVSFTHDDKIIVQKAGKNLFTVLGVSGGESSITISTKSSEYTSISDTAPITVHELSKTKLSQFYSDYVKKSTYTVSASPSTGDVKLLVIPLWFNDSNQFLNNTAKENVKKDIQTTYFGSTSDTGWHSVASYYKNESDGRLRLTGTVSDWYNVNKTYKNYVNDDGHGTATASLIDDAAKWYFDNNPGDPRSNYDYDGDGYLDGVIGIYAVPDKQSMNKSNEYPNLWAYCSNTGQPASVSSPNVKAFFWASYDFMYGSQKALERTGEKYYHGDTSHCKVDAHTFIHEMGHVLGLEDYYDTTYQYNPAGGFSMQDANVGGHDPFSTMALGWTDPYIPNRSMSLKIYSFQESKDVVLLTPKWNDADSPFDEYLLLELYTPSNLNELDSTYRYFGNYPQGVKDTGIRLWHVDARLATVRSRVWSTDLVTDLFSIPSDARILTAFSNSSLDMKNPSASIAARHLSPLVKDGVTSTYVYAEYDLLHLLRNNKSASYTGDKDDNFDSSHLFKEGETFTMKDYGSQFYNSGKLDSGLDLRWSFTISEIGKDSGGTYAFIELNYK